MARHMAIRDAWHSIRSSPATILFAVLVLTGASAAGTVAFSVVDAVVWRSLPYTNSDRIVVVGPDRPFLRNSWPEEYLAWRSRAGAFTAIAATSVGPVAELPFGAGVATVRAW